MSNHVLRVYRWKDESSKDKWSISASGYQKLVAISNDVMNLDVLVCGCDIYQGRNHVMKIDGIDYDYGISIFTTDDIEKFLVELSKDEVEKLFK